MKKILLSLIAFFLIIPVVSSAPAAPTNIKLDSTTSETATFSWSPVPNTLGYYLYWGTKPGVNGVYENEEVNPINDTKYELKGLMAGKKYYIALSSIDNDGEESALSQEFTLSLDTSTTSSSSFSLDSVESVNLGELEFSFSRDLEDSQTASREFVIKSSGGDQISVASTQLGDKKNTLQVFLGKDMNYNTSYQATVLAIKDATGKTIENGIDAVTEFTTPDSFDTIETDLNSAGPQEALSQTATGQLSSIDTGTQTASIVGTSGGKVISSEETDKYTIVAAKQNDDLPKTGPGLIFLGLLALFSGGFYFYYKHFLKKI